MGNISIKLNLAQFKSALMTTPKGEECIVLPLKGNDFFKSEKGNIFVDIIGFEIQNKKTDSKDTHLLKQSLSKEKYDSMTDEQRRAMPIVGNAIVWDMQSGYSEPEPNMQSKDIANSVNDLPF